MAEINKSYEPRDVERKWYDAWLQSGQFAGRVDLSREPYCVLMPPPNVTGVLTMGHVLNNTLQDILIRRARLEGKAALWLPGTDHAGIATQTVVERELRKEKRSRHDLGREQFVGRVRAWREEKGGIILEQLRRLGASCDWSRTQFTMDPHYSRAVLTVFVDLFRKGRIYRGKRMVNWCPGSLTALSDEEVEMRPVQGLLYQVRYEVVGQPGVHLEVKTTRPETIPGDVALAVHPDDPRYAAFVGRMVRRPLGPPAEIPVIADAAVDREFGTGALKITPAHDKLDFEIGQRHGLPVVEILRPDATLNDLAGPGLAGLERFAARRQAAELLRAAGALVREEPYEHSVGFSERAGVVVEPRLTWQWWLRYPRVEEAVAAVEEGHIRFYPEQWKKVYLHWLAHLQDWCISRQLWWGHRIPVWYRRGLDREQLTESDLRDPARVHVSLEGPADPRDWVQDEDVLDTWASSWIWPLATLGWPDPLEMAKAGYEYFYPTTTLVTGPDIIFFWVARMIMAGLEYTHPGQPLMHCVPFKNVYFTGLIRDAQGRKMSKSLGNSPDPLDLIEKYGADGLRFGLVSIAPQGHDIRFQEERIASGQNFCNKLWNAARFRLRGGPAAGDGSLAALYARLAPERFDADDHAILDRLLATTREVDRCFAEFEFSAAAQALYGFFWNDFCDWYVEVSKSKLQAPDLQANCLAVQDIVLRQTLLMLHPFIPFITEELWHQLGFGAEGTFVEEARLGNASQFAAAGAARGVVLDTAAAAEVERIKQTVSLLRALKAEQGEAANKRSVFVVEAADRQWAAIEASRPVLRRLLGAAEINRGPLTPGAAVCLTAHGSWNLVRPVRADTAAERTRLDRDLAELARHIAAAQARLGNDAFVRKAPPAVLEGAKRQLAELQAREAEVRRLLATLT